MPRVPRRRQWTDAACYHFLNRGHNREAVVADDEDRLYFLKLRARYRDRYEVRLYHYCLMSNHFHVLLQLREPRALSVFGAGLLRAYVHYFHRRHGFVGHLWQGRFKSPAVETDEYLLSCGRYIERNPVEAEMVAQPWEYRWSSCRAYALGERDEFWRRTRGTRGCRRGRVVVRGCGVSICWGTIRRRRRYVGRKE